MTLIATKKNSGASTAIITAWLIAGTLDMSAACLQFYLKYNRSPLLVPKFITGALFDKDKLPASAMTIVGFLLHYFIAFVFTLVFFLVFPRVKVLAKNLFLTGMIYGILVWVIMNLLVLPVTKLPPHKFGPDTTPVEILILMFCIGLPISLVIGKYFKKRI